MNIKKITIIIMISITILLPNKTIVSAKETTISLNTTYNTSLIDNTTSNQTTTTSNICSEECNDIAPAVRIIKKGIIPIFQIIIPIALILMGMIDFTKAVLAKLEDMKKIQTIFIKRCLYAVTIFFVVTIVTLVFNLIGESGITENEVEGTMDWLTCYANVDNCTN